MRYQILAYLFSQFRGNHAVFHLPILRGTLVPPPKLDRTKRFAVVIANCAELWIAQCKQPNLLGAVRKR